MAKKNENRTLNLEQAGEELSVHKETLRRYIGQGAPHSRGKHNKILVDATEIAAWMEDQGLTGKVGRPHDESSADLDEARRLKEIEMARNWRLRNEKIEQQMIDAEDVKRGWASAISTLKTQLLNIPAQVAGTMEGMSLSERHEVVEQAIRDVLENYDPKREPCTSE